MTEPASPARAPRRAAFVFIFVTVMLDMLALGMLVPVMPALILDMRGGDSASAAHVVGVFGTAWAAMQFAAMPTLGALSDRIGRRPVVLISNFGQGADYVLMALAPNLAWLFVGRLISGVTSASITTAFAYITDVTAPEKRAGAFGALGAAFGAGFVLGPALGGLIGDLHPRAPFWVAAGFSLVNGLYGLFVLPESLPAERRAPFSLRKANPFGAFALLLAEPRLLGLAAVKLLNDLAHVVYPATFALCAMYRYRWSEREVGLTLAAYGVIAVIVQGGLVGRIVAAIGETRALMLGLGAGVLGFALYALASEPLGLWLAMPVAALWGLSNPSNQALMTRLVGSSEQGRLQGALGGLTGVAGLVGPTLFTMVFAYFISTGAPAAFPGAAFAAAALLIALSIPLALAGARLAAAPAPQTAPLPAGAREE